MTSDATGTPTVSVILATNVLNDWLDLAVRSILDQDGVDLELVVVHDQLEIDHGRPWTGDPRVTLAETGVSHGLAHALTVGIAVSRGRYLARLDADDVALAGRLKAQVGYLDAHPDVVLLGTAARRIDEQGQTTGTLGRVPNGDVRELLLTRDVIIHPSVMMRREAYAAAGGYDARLLRMQDYDLWLRMARLGEVHVLPQPLVAYRVSPHQSSRGTTSTGRYIWVVLVGRAGLARHLGASPLVQRVRDLAWWGVQVARAKGWRRPGHER